MGFVPGRWGRRPVRMGVPARRDWLGLVYLMPELGRITPWLRRGARLLVAVR